ncbi:MAG TPA: hypothetical protein VIN56_02410 [Candidatus Dormibacteraeota bacterium]
MRPGDNDDPAKAMVAEEACQACGGQLWDMGTQDFAVGNVNTLARGITPFGEGLAPERVPLELFACNACRRVELRVPASAFE